jgi:outer membrane protein assembly factor BamB
MRFRAVGAVGVVLVLGGAAIGCELVIPFGNPVEGDPGGAGSCTDGVRDGKETDVDCGGGACPACPDGKGCLLGSDCVDKVCSGGSCVPPSCTDQVKNGTETDVDCGGSCSPCGFGKTCRQNADCKGMVCTGGACQATCNDGVKNGMETDVDCGGPTCMQCADTLGCAVDGDCQSGICQGGKCAAIAWSKSFPVTGVMSSVTNLGVATDGLGNVLLAGNFDGTVNFGMMPLTSAGAIAKFDPNGKPLWSKALVGGGGGSAIAGMTADAMGLVYLTGALVGSLNLGGNCNISAPASAKGSAFVVKLDMNGLPLPTFLCERFGDTGVLEGTAVAVDGTGNILVSGLLLGDATFGTTMLTAGTSLDDRFVVKLDAMGNPLWAQAFPSSAIRSVAFDPMGNVLLAAFPLGPTSLGGPMLMTMESPDLCVAKLDPSGKHVWSKCFGVGGGGSPLVQDASIAVDAQGNLFLGGGFSGGLDFGGGPLMAMGNIMGKDAFLAKLDPTGAHLFS